MLTRGLKFHRIAIDNSMEMFDIKELKESFEFVRTLDSNLLAKKVVLLGKIRGQDAIVTMEKTPFDESSVPIQDVNLLGANDIYYWFMATLDQDIHSSPTAKVNLIFPATQKHIDKYRKSEFRMVKETPEVYERIVQPYIESQRGTQVQWVRNILYHGAEAERVLFKNEDYIVLPDMKWDGTSIDSLYCCCIVYDESIASIRDLNSTHVEYLERIQESLLAQVSEKYEGITRNKLKLYVHYQPTYYHFHIHVVNADFDGVPGSMAVGKAIALNDVIEDLKLRGKEGMKSKTMVYALFESHALWELGLKNYGV